MTREPSKGQKMRIADARYSVKAQRDATRTLAPARRSLYAGEVPLARALEEVLARAGIRKNHPVSRISEGWEAIVGAEIASHARIVGYKSGVLGIEVDSAPWLQELSSFRRGEILERLAEGIPEVKVHDLKFSVRG